MSIGPQPNFHEYDVHRALHIIASKGPIGRHLLTKNLELTECSVRTILKKLMQLEYIDSTPLGQIATDSGKEYVSSLHYYDNSEFIDAGQLSLGDYDFVIVKKSAAHLISSGIDQRDKAIIIGGTGATVLIYANGALEMPPGFMDISDQYPEDVKRILSTFSLDEGDVVVIGSGSSKRYAQLAAMAAYDSLV